MDIRTLLDKKQQPYYKINREERNLAAVFYHTLLLGDNLQRFLYSVGYDAPIIPEETGIYFEYAHIRDLWNNIKGDDLEALNAFKRKVILDLLNPSNREELEAKSIYEFNQYFGAVRTQSAKHIASPGNWSIPYFDPYIADNEAFLEVCKFKWCFNAKPDIVIHTTNDHALCIEAKYESGEGKYPSTKKDQDIFRRRFAQDERDESYMVGQLSIQQKIMNELLGLQDTQFLYLVQKKGKGGTVPEVSWGEAFGVLDTESCPYFVKEWIKQVG